MNKQQLEEYIDRHLHQDWWFMAAKDAIDKGTWTTITERDNDDLYLARFWLNDPKYSQEEGRETDFDSANSIMLHYFVRPDTDKALHDHPWDFSTTILTGSYEEHMPTEEWFKTDQLLGPAWGANVVTRKAKETVIHLHDDLHCIGSVEENTWTLVSTKDRIDGTWGFHPEGETWVDYVTYLNSQKQKL